MPSRGLHHHRLHTRVEVDGDVKGTGANGTVKDDDVGDEDDVGKFVALELDLEVDGTTKTTMFPGHCATDRAAVYLQRHKNNSTQVLRPPRLTADPPPPRTNEDTVFALFAAAPTPAVKSPPP